jgi:aminopeptidase N
MIPAMVYTYRLFPLFGLDADFLAFTGAVADSAAPVVRKTMLQRTDQVRRMLRSRGA